jgi:hypothetical protein
MQQHQDLQLHQLEIRYCTERSHSANESGTCRTDSYIAIGGTGKREGCSVETALTGDNETEGCASVQTFTKGDIFLGINITCHRGKIIIVGKYRRLSIYQLSRLTESTKEQL